MDYASIIIPFAGGLGLFLYGMHIMASGLQKAAGNKLKKVLEVITKNKFLGILIGAFVTAIIQSSSATTVMVVGFVNAGIMNLAQTVGIIMGANIGTTITSWIVSSVEWAKFLNPSYFAPIAVAIGACFVLFAKRERMKQIGEIIVGFGILFIGINAMTTGLEPLRESELFKEMFRVFGRNPILGVLAGAIVTAVIQSSSASVGILQSLANSGLVTWNSAVYIIMGQNIGTCVTAMLSSVGASRNAKGAAYIHLLFNVLGSVLFSVLAFLFFTFINVKIGELPISLTEISLVHTIFNVANTLLMFPFSGLLVKIAEKLCSVGKSSEEDEEILHLDDRILETPSFAIQNCIKEIVRMGYMSYDNLKMSSEAVFEKDSHKIEKVLRREKNIDMFQKGITQYMVKLCGANINETENSFITSLFHTVNDVERIGDYCENLVEISQYMINDDVNFSKSAKDGLTEIVDATINCVNDSIKALETGDITFAISAIKGEERVDEMEKNLRALHIQRLTNNECQPTAGIEFLDCLTNLERISDHAQNIAQGVISRANI